MPSLTSAKKGFCFDAAVPGYEYVGKIAKIRALWTEQPMRLLLLTMIEMTARSLKASVGTIPHIVKMHGVPPRRQARG